MATLTDHSGPKPLSPPQRPDPTAQWSSDSAPLSFKNVEWPAWIADVTHDADDGSWQFHDNSPGDPSDEDGMMVALSSMALRDDTLNELPDLPEGWCAWRDSPGAPWNQGKIG